MKVHFEIGPKTSAVVRRFAWTVGIVLLALFFAVQIKSGTRDPDSYGFLAMGMFMLGTPSLAVGALLSFLFRRTIVGDVLGGITFFIAAFLAVITYMN